MSAHETTVHLIDLQYLGDPSMIGAYVVVGPSGHPVLIETGPASTAERLMEGIRELGFSIADIQDVLVTHIHLDHAGAAGHLAAHPEFTGRIHVHQFGMQHLVDPSRLISSAQRIYGDQMDRLWGQMVPVPADRVVALEDGAVIDTADMHFTVMETPGHARHHCCFILHPPSGKGRPVCFTGDVAGMVVPKEQTSKRQNVATEVPPTSKDGDRSREAADHFDVYPFINLPTPPPEFDAEQWIVSIARLERARLGSLYLTHFGEVRTPDSHFLAVRRAIRAHTEFVRTCLGRRLEASATVDLYRSWVLRQAHSAGIEPERARRFVSDNLIQMNVTGITRYMQGLQPSRSRH